MELKFYTKEDNPLCLYCMDRDQLYWFIAPWSEDAHWFQCDGIKDDLIEIAESEAQEKCNGRVYTAEVWVPKKKKGVKIYNSLLDVPNPNHNKVLLLGIVFGVLTIFGSSIVMVALGSEIKSVFYFWLSAACITGCGLLFEKITGLGDGEGIAIFILIALVLRKIFH